MKTRSQAANAAIAQAPKPSKPTKASQTKPRTKRTKPPDRPAAQVIIPSLPTGKETVKSEPKLDLLLPIPKKLSEALSGNLLDLEPREKEESIRQWVDSQRCINVPTEHRDTKSSLTGANQNAVESKISTSPEVSQSGGERTRDVMESDQDHNNNNNKEDNPTPAKKKNQTITRKNKDKKEKKTHTSKVDQQDENALRTPVVLIDKKKNSRNGARVLKPKKNNPNLGRNQPASKNNGLRGLHSKPSNRKRSNDKLDPIDNDLNLDDQDSPPPDRKARLSFYKNLDNFSLEEEIIV